MLILPPDHVPAGQRGSRLSRREKWLVRGVAAVAAALVLAVIISLAIAGRGTGHGCVQATFPGPVGAEQVFRCGAQARSLCRALGTASGYTGEAARTIAVECRKARLPVGP